MIQTTREIDIEAFKPVIREIYDKHEKDMIVFNLLVTLHRLGIY
jgi:hypothetical protein